MFLQSLQPGITLFKLFKEKFQKCKKVCIWTRNQNLFFRFQQLENKIICPAKVFMLYKQKLYYFLINTQYMYILLKENVMSIINFLIKQKHIIFVLQGFMSLYNFNNNKEMAEQSVSPIKNRSIVSSLNKLNKAASEGRFRIKSLRVKTMQAQQQKQKNTIQDRNYESQLMSKGFAKQFLKSLYIVKSDEAQIKISDAKYYTFVKSLHTRLHETCVLNLAICNFQIKSAEIFLNQFVNINREVITYDVSKCAFLPKYENQNPNAKWIIQKIIRVDKRIAKLVAKNMGWTSYEIKKVLDLIVDTENIFQLDIGNENSQSMNRFTEQLDILYDFFKVNPTVSVMGLENLNLRKIGVQQIQKGVTLNINNPLKILNLKNNGINENASLHISVLVRSGLVQLNLSENPLTPAFYLSLPSWKLSTIRKLNISMTQMDSQSFIFFLSRVEQNKALQYLKADNNDLSHHWFNQTKQMLQVNTSIQYLSLVNCKINRTSQTFSGLVTNRYMKKINLSYNYFTEGVKELCDMIRLNKVVTQIKLRSCGIKTESFIKIFESMDGNDKITALDISQNEVGQQGAKQILKTLNANNTLSYLGFEKSQIPYGLRDQIQRKINTNREVKKQKEIGLLKKQNKVVKQYDIHTWDQVSELQARVRANNKIIASLESKVHGLEKQYDQRKFRLYQILKDCKQKENSLTDDFNLLVKKIKQLESEQMNYMKKYKIKEQNLIQAMDKEASSIQSLQRSIKEESLKNQARESQLQDQYENFKYLQKKKQQKKAAQMKRAGFDTSTALNTKRRSGNN